MSPTSHRATPAVVLGNGLTVLGVLRCLGRIGIPAFCLSRGLGFEGRSRWCRRLGPGLDAFEDASRLEQVLGALPFERAVLIACSDHWTVEATRISAALKDRFRASLPDSDTLGRLVDKAAFAELLASAGVAHPLTVIARTEGDVRDTAEKSRGELFLKPANSQRFLQEFGKKAFRIADLGEALEIFRRARKAGLEIMIQEYVPGPADRHYFVDGFVDRLHGLHAVFARRRIRMFPPDFGNSSFMVSVGVDEVSGAVDAVRTLFGAARYRGIFSAEFKLDERDGKFKILEVNCRPWWYVQFAAECGVNVVEMAYCDALDLPVPAARRYKNGTRLVFPYYDLPGLMRSSSSTMAVVREVARSWPFARTPIFAWDDPRPAASDLARRISGRIRRLVGAGGAR